MRIGHWLMVLGFALAWLTAESENFRRVHALAGESSWRWPPFGSCGAFSAAATPVRPVPAGPADVIAYLASLADSRPQPQVGHNPAGGWAIVGLLALALGVGGTGLLAFNDLAGHWLEELHEGLAIGFLTLVGAHLAGCWPAACGIGKTWCGPCLPAARRCGGCRHRRRPALAALLLVVWVGVAAGWLPPDRMRRSCAFCLSKTIPSRRRPDGRPAPGRFCRRLAARRRRRRPRPGVEEFDLPRPRPGAAPAGRHGGSQTPARPRPGAAHPHPHRPRRHRRQGFRPRRRCRRLSGQTRRSRRTLRPACAPWPAARPAGRRRCFATAISSSIRQPAASPWPEFRSNWPGGNTPSSRCCWKTPDGADPQPDRTVDLRLAGRTRQQRPGGSYPPLTQEIWCRPHPHPARVGYTIAKV